MHVLSLTPPTQGLPLKAVYRDTVVGIRYMHPRVVPAGSSPVRIHPPTPHIGPHVTMDADIQAFSDYIPDGRARSRIHRLYQAHLPLQG